MNNAIWFMGGVIASFVVLIIAVLIEEWVENCGRKRIERLADEFAKKMELAEEENAEHTRKCLAEQKEQIEEVGRKAREYQSARFQEERENIASKAYDEGYNHGRQEMVEKLSAKVKSGELIINRSVDKH